ncbi:MAG: DUF502 domain-containing protein [Selenomonadaceae bacterium]|nr:DUF502 domain-containing protein [Selenomonadaceae bacterium]
MDKKNNGGNVIADYFISGLIVLIPLAITFFVVKSVLDITEGDLGMKSLPFYFPGLGLVTLLIVIFVVGWISSHWLLKKLIAFGESLLDKIPVVKFIYKSVKQFSTAMFESNSLFNTVVLVPFHQSLTMGFLISDAPRPVNEKLDGEYVCVFVPWSLNMTSGTNLFVKKSDVIRVDIKPEDALRFMLTAGAVKPH